MPELTRRQQANVGTAIAEPFDEPLDANLLAALGKVFGLSYLLGRIVSMLSFLGAGAFIGSNSALVAPITIGDGAIVGAGSTLTRKVPDDALAVERADERHLEGYAPRIHARNKRRAGKK